MMFLESLQNLHKVKFSKKLANIAKINGGTSGGFFVKNKLVFECNNNYYVLFVTNSLPFRVGRLIRYIK